MINKNQFKKIIKREILPLKINFVKNKKMFDNFNSCTRYQLESYLDSYFLSITDSFYKINAILINIKYTLLDNNKTNTIEKIELVFGKNNGNNIYSLIKFIEKNSTIKFDNDFIFYCCILETLIRHQYSHGFGKSLLYLLDADKKEFTLFYNKEKWMHYIEEEKNQNVFYMLYNTYFNYSDFMDSCHVNGNISLFLNSFSTRKIVQFREFKIMNDSNFNSFLLNKFKTQNLKPEIKLHKLETMWVEQNSLIRIRARKLDLITITKKEPKNIAGKSTLELSLKLIIKDLFMFNNFNGCTHNNRTKPCPACILYRKLEKMNIKSSKKYLLLVKQEIFNINYKKSEEIFIEIVKAKINEFNKENKNKKEIFNTYFAKIIKEVFGVSSYLPIDYTNLLKKNEESTNEIKKIFNYFIEIGVPQFLCYGFSSDTLIPTRYKAIDSIINSNNDIIINNENIFLEIRKQFYKIYTNL